MPSHAFVTGQMGECVQCLILIYCLCFYAFFDLWFARGVVVRLGSGSGSGPGCVQKVRFQKIGSIEWVRIIRIG